MPKDKRDEPEDDRPWTEEQWEKMMRESDVRAARFGELLETLMDHPERDVRVAREMGWNELADMLEANPRDAGESDHTSPDPEPAIESEEDSDEDNPFEDEEDRAVRKIPAYVACQRAAHAVNRALKPYQRVRPRKDETVGELISEAYIGIHIACAKISGGHAMGYEDDVLCGNIVNNKRALEGARQSIQAFEILKTNRKLPAELVDRLMPLLKESEAAIEARIAELRAKVWWS
jgi:hypothetical protein